MLRSGGSHTSITALASNCSNVAERKAEISRLKMTNKQDFKWVGTPGLFVADPRG